MTEPTRRQRQVAASCSPHYLSPQRRQRQAAVKSATAALALAGQSSASAALCLPVIAPSHPDGRCSIHPHLVALVQKLDGIFRCATMVVINKCEGFPFSEREPDLAHQSIGAPSPIRHEFATSLSDTIGDAVALPQTARGRKRSVLEVGLVQ